MGRIVAWTPSLTGGIVVVRDPCLHGRFSIGSLCVGPSDTMSWSPTIGLLITPQEPIQPRLGGRVERFPSTFRTEVVLYCSCMYTLYTLYTLYIPTGEPGRGVKDVLPPYLKY